MKTVKYLLCTIITLIAGIGVVSASASVTTPTTVYLSPNETRDIEIQLTDIMALMDIRVADSSVLQLNTPTLDLKTDGPGTVTGKINVKALKTGSTTITITSSDAAEFSTGTEYAFPQKTITVNVMLAGDVNLDGKVSTVDYVKLWNHLDRNNANKITDSDQLLAADVNHDGKVSTLDCMAVWNILKR